MAAIVKACTLQRRGHLLLVGTKSGGSAKKMEQKEVRARRRWERLVRRKASSASWHFLLTIAVAMMMRMMRTRMRMMIMTMIVATTCQADSTAIRVNLIPRPDGRRLEATVMTKITTSTMKTYPTKTYRVDYTASPATSVSGGAHWMKEGIVAVYTAMKLARKAITPRALTLATIATKAMMEVVMPAEAFLESMEGPCDRVRPAATAAEEVTSRCVRVLQVAAGRQ
mmetsp:Transcript_30374/g.55783  ORF Transcript_30374/g.55783 Transcript_30374/m.55783 type:complete len:226 (+) Transcript_30374:672-1349(+)